MPLEILHVAFMFSPPPGVFFPSTTTISKTGSNWLFAGSLRAGQRAANVMSLIQSAKLNGHDPYCYLKDRTS